MSDLKSLLIKLAELNIDRVNYHSTDLHSNENKNKTHFVFEGKDEGAGSDHLTKTDVFNKKPKMHGEVETVFNQAQSLKSQLYGDQTDKPAFSCITLDVGTGVISKSYSSFSDKPNYYVKEVEALKKLAGVDRVSICYSGSGDSEGTHFITFYDKNNQVVDVSASKEALEKAESFGYRLPSELFPGWEVGDGSNGTIDFNFRNGQLNVEHTSYYQKAVEAEPIQRNIYKADLDAQAVTIASSLKDRVGGANKLLIDFSGSNDSSSVFNIRLIGTESESQALSSLESSALEDMAYDLLYSLEIGWEKNEGTAGQLAFDLATGDVVIEYDKYKTESEENELSDMQLIAYEVYNPETDGLFETFVSDKLKGYVVMYKADEGEPFVFVCQAEDEEHACSQSVDSYGEGEDAIEIVWVQQESEEDFQNAVDAYHDNQKQKNGPDRPTF